MACFYYKKEGDKEIKYKDNAAMVNDFLKGSQILSNASIFSSEDVQKSVIDNIRKLHNVDSYNSADYVNEYKFISEPNPKVFGGIRELIDTVRLSPQYIIENRMKTFITDRIAEVIKEGKTLDASVQVDEKNLKLMLENSEVAAFNNSDAVRYLLAEFEKVLDIEEKTQEMSRAIHNMIYDVLSKDISYKEAFKKHFDSSKVDLYGEESDNNTGLWEAKLISIVSTIVDKIDNYGFPLTELKIVTSETSPVQVSSAIDLVAVASDGTVHIFDIRISKDPYKAWDSAKKLTADWALAIKRQILGQSINIDNVQLHIIPIVVQGLKDSNLVTDGEFKIRSTDVTSGITREGMISGIADKLIPRKIFAPYDPGKADKLRSRMDQVISKNYEVRTEFEDHDVELIIKEAEKSLSKNGSFRKYNPHKNIEDLNEGFIEVKPVDMTKEEVDKAREIFRRSIEKYVAFIKSQENRGVATLLAAITGAIKTHQTVEITKHSTRLQHILNEYLNDDWEAVEIKEGLAMGIIVLRNKLSGVVNLLNVSADLFKAPVSEGDDSIKDKLYQELDVLKAMIFLDEFKNDLLPGKSYKFGQILSFNPKNGDTYYMPMTKALRLYRERLASKNLSSEIKIKESDLLGIEDIALNDVMTVMKFYGGQHEKSINIIRNILGDGHIESIDKERLIAARDAFIDEFPDYINKTIEPKLDFDDEIGVIFALLQTAILTKEGMILHGDFRDLTKFSFQSADFKSLISSVYTKNVQEYDKTGKKIQGLFQGLIWSSPEWVQSKDLRQINTLASTGNSVIGEKFLKINEKISSLTSGYYKSINYNTLKRMTIGESQSKYKNMFLEGNTYTTKNPYKTDAVNIMEANETAYLQQMLLLINQYVYGISEDEISKIDATDINSVRTNKTLAELLDNGGYFEMPLMRREEMSKYGDSFKINGDDLNIKGFIRDNLRDLVDSRELSKHDLNNVNRQQMGFFKMYDPYYNQRGEIRAKMLAESPGSYFEMNLDTIANKAAFTKVRKQTFDLILPTINAYIWWIKLAGAKQNEDGTGSVAKQIEYIVNQVKLAVFDSPLIGDEEATLAKGLGVVKQFSTFSMLAFRPALLVKEMTIGLMRNFSSSAIGLSDEFNAEDMAKAYTKLITIDNKFSDEFNMIDRLNHFYRMANMDISTMSKKVQADRWGVNKGLGRYMFMTSTLGDYYNRMAILMAKMIHEGSYDAHYMDGKFLRYDVKKDKRFSKYLAERDNHKDKDGNYTEKKGDVEYNTQRRRYLLSLEQMNKEGKVTNEKVLKEADLLPKAYSQQERNSIKSYSDLMYGAYDKDSQAQVGNTLAGIAFMQFLTYWPNKMKFWFGKTVDSEDSPIGKVKQMTEKDADGVEKLVWRDNYIAEDGTEQWKPTTDVNTGDPVLIYEGTPQEGIFISFLYTMQDIVTWNTKELKNNKLRRSRAMFAVVDAALMVILLAIMREIYKNLMETQERGTFTGELTAFMANVNTKVLREYDVWDNTFGALKTEPVFLSWGLRTAQNFQDAIFSDKDIMKLAANSIGAFEMFK